MAYLYDDEGNYIDYGDPKSEGEKLKNCIAMLNGMKEKQLLPKDFPQTWLEGHAKKCFGDNVSGQSWTPSELLKERHLDGRDLSPGWNLFKETRQDLFEKNQK